MKLIGLDVGFSTTRRSSGVTCLNERNLSVGCATASWESRSEILADCDHVQVVALDAPLLPTINYEPRTCERVFTFGRFQRRCKPGLSHIRGTGRELRDAGHESAKQLSKITSGCDLVAKFPRVWAGQNIVEAFPNAFLGVLLSGGTFDQMPQLKRGAKFDWLFEECCATNRISHVVDVIGRSELKEVLSSIETNRDHDQRAALICLLTAAGVAVGRYTAVGDQHGGYFFLPPWDVWSPWAQQEITVQRNRVNSLDMWIDGRRFSPGDFLPSAGTLKVELFPMDCQNTPVEEDNPH